jgi:hypothetical protein
MYGMPDLSPRSLFELATRLAVDDELFRLYGMAFSQFPSVPEPDCTDVHSLAVYAPNHKGGYCKTARLCPLIHFDDQDYNACLAARLPTAKPKPGAGMGMNLLSAVVTGAPVAATTPVDAKGAVILENKEEGVSMGTPFSAEDTRLNRILAEPTPAAKGKKVDPAQAQKEEARRSAEDARYKGILEKAQVEQVQAQGHALEAVQMKPAIGVPHLFNASAQVAADAEKPAIGVPHLSNDSAQVAADVDLTLSPQVEADADDADTDDVNESS